MSVRAHGLTPLEGGPTYPLGQRLIRLCWNVTWIAACSWTPRQWRGWRRRILKGFGADMAPGTDVSGSASIWLPSNLVMKQQAVIGPHVEVYNTARVTLRERALVSQGAYLCAGTHDYTHPEFLLVTKPIIIGENVWIGAKAIVGPGVTVGEESVLGAGAVAFRDLPPNGVYAGNPAVRVKDRWPDGGCPG